MQPFLALITPLAGGHVDNTLPGIPTYPDQGLPSPQPPVGIWPSPGRPTHPIAPGGRPGRPGHLPAYPGRPVDPGYGIEGPVDPGYGVEGPAPGTPEHPIELPPDGEPGSPTNPIVLPPLPPGRPTNPIAGPRPPGNVVIWVPGRGYVVVQPGVGPDNSLPGAPPTAQPKR